MDKRRVASAANVPLPAGRGALARALPKAKRVWRAKAAPKANATPTAKAKPLTKYDDVTPEKVSNIETHRMKSRAYHDAYAGAVRKGGDVLAAKLAARATYKVVATELRKR
jgi:hypothetical protein